jgi:prohibitin 1
VLKRVWLRFRRYVFEHGPELAVFVLLGVLLAIVVAPRMIYTIPGGYVGVLWKRFGGGTVLDRTLGEGIKIIPPWDRIFLYDVRLQLLDQDFDVLAEDGLKVKINIAYRFWLNPEKVPLLHKSVGPQYAEVLLSAAIGAQARDVFAKNMPDEIYSGRRVQIQTEILRQAQESLQKTFVRPPENNTQFLRLEDVFIRSITLPSGVEMAITRKNEWQQKNEEYDYRLLLESKESERKRIEARGIREFQDIISSGITESYLRWRGVDATMALANSPNSKVVIIGGGKDGLPIILGNADGAATGAEVRSSAPNPLGRLQSPSPSGPPMSLMPTERGGSTGSSPPAP